MGLKPSRSVLYEFRDRAANFVDQLHQQIVRLAQAEKKVEGRQTVQDGTIVRACASRHFLHHSETMQRRMKELNEAVRKDSAGITAHPSCRWIARTADGRARQALRYQKACQELQKRLELNAKRQAGRRLPIKHVVISVSDPEAALGRDKEKVFGPCYSIQCVTDAQSLLIVAFDVIARTSDAGTLAPMLDRTREILGRFPDQHIADAAYVTTLDLKDSNIREVQLVGPFQENDLTERKRRQKPHRKKLGKEAFRWLPKKQTYRCPQGHELKLHQRGRVERSDGRTLMQSRFRCPPVHCQSCPLAAGCCTTPRNGRIIKRLDGEELLEKHQRYMKTPDAKKLLRKRGSVIERTFADLKAHRGLRCLHGRGLSRATAEIGLVIIAHNILRCYYLRRKSRSRS